MSEYYADVKENCKYLSYSRNRQGKMASALLVQKEVSSEEYTIKTRKNEGKNTVKTSVKMILERVALTGKTQKPDRKIETRKGYEEYFLCSPASMFLRGLSNLF